MPRRAKLPGQYLHCQVLRKEVLKMEKLGYYKPVPCGFTGGWEKYSGEKPLFGGAMGTVFDCYVIIEDGLFKMWYSWRPTNTIVYATSTDGIHWTLPRVVLT